MLDGIYEQVTLPTGITEHKYYVGDAVVTKRSNSTTDTFYLHKDQQGSTTAITNAAGTTVQQLMYDPWGKQFLVNNSILSYSSPAQSKGYTGHEMVNDFEVIHMGGRTYNPTLGRFMQADPFIQEPGNLQSYNRYAYVQNNPMSYTDPSGYFIAGLLKSAVRSVLKLIPQNVGNFMISLGAKFCGQWAGACAAAATYEFSRAHGMSRTGALRAAAAAGAAAYAFGKIGEYYGDVGDQNFLDALENGADFSQLTSFGGNLLTGGQIAGQIAAHAVTGGIVSSIGGGKFGHGFFSAGVTKGLGTPISAHFDQGVISGTITQMVIGGTASVIAGGKFANGARTAAYQYLFNQMSKVNYKQILKDVKRTWREYWLDEMASNTHGCNVIAGMDCIPLALNTGITLTGAGALVTGSFRLSAYSFSLSATKWSVYDRNSEGVGWLVVDAVSMRATSFFHNDIFLHGADHVMSAYSYLFQTGDMVHQMEVNQNKYCSIPIRCGQ
ncbi:RHS repeat-associated core domain-containing protein [Rheinheimera sp. F8]|uniref:RHS repeat domain-containing protein n=1 Tax=Rheinheimera sp. F8 TaxID=1763998 RepID=UPI000744C3F6|nr:RHS repeat-associated core domain-containing protein [Rheinheimera sp. F8]ALZ75267.1 hypothetical protein ATY27_05515 [Rheinheimera sp. F8]ALZ76307.1 hypothetical protein ATY27_11430 [Rheinheimera sp. F8]